MDIIKRFNTTFDTMGISSTYSPKWPRTNEKSKPKVFNKMSEGDQEKIKYQNQNCSIKRTMIVFPVWFIHLWF